MTELEQKIVDLKASRASLAHLQELQAAKQTEVADLQGQLVMARAGMGERILEATMAGSGDATETAVVTEVATIGARIEAATSLIGALDKRIATAQAGERHAQAECLRADARQLRAQAAERMVHTNELLAQLKDYEGVDYVVDPTATTLERGKPAGVSAFGMTFPDTLTGNTSRTQALLNLAVGYEADAGAIEQGQPIPWSVITGKQIAALPEYILQ